MNLGLNRAVLGVLFAVTPVMNAAVVLDTFDSTFQAFTVNPLSTNGAGVFTNAGESVFGARYVRLTNYTNDAGNADAITVNGANNKRATLSTDADNRTFANFLWDGGTDAVMNHTMHIDLTAAGQNFMFLLAYRADLAGAPIVMTVYSGAGNASQYSIVTTATGFGVAPFHQAGMNFMAFTTIAGTGANFADVTAVTLNVNGSGADSIYAVDVQIDYFAASNVPEPTTMGLTALGLSTAALLRRRKA